MIKTIGGYFDLELNSGRHFHNNAIRLNTGRNAFEYILRVKKYKKIFLPYFTCDAMLEPIYKLGLMYEFYSINEDFSPQFDLIQLNKDEAFVYTNYFGLCNHIVSDLSKKASNIIIDNSQAFFTKRVYDVDTFYSARKFFGVPDGAYLYTNKLLKKKLERDISYSRMSHLLIRKDTTAEYGYRYFENNDISLSNNDIKHMSRLTDAILESIDYTHVLRKRRENFIFLFDSLKEKNKLIFNLDRDVVPLVLPYWSEDITLKERLKANKIYCATYWPNIKKWCNPNSLEYRLMNEVVYLPIDQRYDIQDLKRVLDHV